MKKIGTHNSATGESGRGFLSWLLTPFAKTQSKALWEQWESGCRMFDFRVRNVNGIWRAAHGLWVSERSAWDMLWELNHLGGCYVSITYEGRLRNENEKHEFKLECVKWKRALKNIMFGPICAKYSDDGIGVDWVRLEEAEKWEKNVQGFFPLDGSTWHTFIPIPWLWDRIKCRPHVFNDKIFTLVDFL